MNSKRWKITKLGQLTLEELKRLIGYTKYDTQPFSGKPLVRVFVADSDVQAQFLMQVLQQENIPALYQSYRDTAYDGIYQFQRGAGAIITSEDAANRAIEVITDVLESSQEEPLKKESSSQQARTDNKSPQNKNSEN